MKKLLALIISVIMVVGIFACTPVTDSTGDGKVNPETVEFTFEQTTLTPGEYTLTAKVMPENASQEVTFTLIGSPLGIALEGAKLTVDENVADGLVFKAKASVITDPTINDTIELTVSNPAPAAEVITTEAQLRAMELGGSYELGANIMLTEAWTPLGTADNEDEGIPGAGFAGVLDGKGYKITNLNIAATWNGGFFAQIEPTGVVKNIGFESDKGANSGVRGNAWTGVIAGINKGLIENCYTDVKVVMGGTPGAAFTGTNKGTGIIRNCYAISPVTVGEGAHGAAFSGANEGTVTASYFLESAGNCAYGWNKTQDANVQKSESWMKTAQNYIDAGWDQDVWALVDGYYPMLKHEGFVAPAPAAVLNILNTEEYLDYNQEEQRTLQIAYEIKNVENTAVTFALAENVAGVSISESGLVSLGAEVVDGAVFTVVVTSVEVATLSMSKSFTVNRAAVDEVVLISNQAELVALTTTTNPADMAKNYRLTADIDVSDIWFNTPIGANAGGVFTGTFDGNGYAIVGIAGGAEGNDYGFFKEIGVGGVVKNLEIKIRDGRNLCANRMGAVASVNKGTISNIVVSGDIWCKYVGVGGIAWDNHGVIENVIMLAKINHYYEAANELGAIAYYQQETAVIRNCFVDREATGLTSLTRMADTTLDAGCLTSAEMKSASTFAAFDASIWNVVDGQYPTLRKGIIA